jgi:hypothetical protein
MTSTGNSNGTHTTRLAPRTVPPVPVRVDADVAYSMAVTLAGLCRRLMPDRYTLLVAAALRQRALFNYRLAQAAEDPADRVHPTMWERRAPAIVHWEVIGSEASPENVVFAACGRHDGIEMRDSHWQHGTENSRPLTCGCCKALLAAARASQRA